MPDRVVWSSDGGDQRRRAGNGGSSRPSTGGPIKVRREIAGRKGKPVTTIANLPLAAADAKQLATDLKKKCGVGGSYKDGVIEIQGDHREKVMAELEKRGMSAVLAGG